MNAPLPPFVKASIQRLKTLIAEAEKLKVHTETTARTARRPSSKGFGAEQVEIPHQYQTYDDSPELRLRIIQAIRQIAPGSLFEQKLSPIDRFP